MTIEQPLHSHEKQEKPPSSWLGRIVEKTQKAARYVLAGVPYELWGRLSPELLKQMKKDFYDKYHEFKKIKQEQIVTSDDPLMIRLARFAHNESTEKEDALKEGITAQLMIKYGFDGDKEVEMFFLAEIGVSYGRYL